jgi:hypothetical protein
MWVVLRSIEQPLREIARNAGDEPSVPGGGMGGKGDMHMSSPRLLIGGPLKSPASAGLLLFRQANPTRPGFLPISA